jgi:hypothetical protein
MRVGGRPTLARASGILAPLVAGAVALTGGGQIVPGSVGHQSVEVRLTADQHFMPMPAPAIARKRHFMPMSLPPLLRPSGRGTVSVKPEKDAASDDTSSVLRIARMVLRMVGAVVLGLKGLAGCCVAAA